MSARRNRKIGLVLDCPRRTMRRAAGRAKGSIVGPGVSRTSAANTACLDVVASGFPRRRSGHVSRRWRYPARRPHQHQEDLAWIGSRILELVDEQPAVPPLERAAHVRARPRSIRARHPQEVHVVHRVVPRRRSRTKCRALRRAPAIARRSTNRAPVAQETGRSRRTGMPRPDAGPPRTAVIGPHRLSPPLHGDRVLARKQEARRDCASTVLRRTVASGSPTRRIPLLGAAGGIRIRKRRRLESSQSAARNL